MAIDGGGIFVFHAGWLILPIRLHFPFSISRKKGGGDRRGKSKWRQRRKWYWVFPTYMFSPMNVSSFPSWIGLCLIKFTSFTIYQIVAPLSRYFEVFLRLEKRVFFKPHSRPFRAHTNTFFSFSPVSAIFLISSLPDPLSRIFLKRKSLSVAAIVFFWSYFSGTSTPPLLQILPTYQ